MPQYNSFVVRVWSENSRILHGEIVHVATQEKMRFSSLNDMQDFILHHLGPTGALPDTEDRGEEACSPASGQGDEERRGE